LLLENWRPQALMLSTLSRNVPPYFTVREFLSSCYYYCHYDHMKFVQNVVFLSFFVYGPGFNYTVLLQARLKYRK